MNTELDTEYEEYLKTKDLTELIQIQGSVDRGKYPARYKLVQEYIHNFKAPASSFHSASKRRRRHSFFELMILALTEGLVLVQGFLAYFSLAFGRKEYTPQPLFEAMIPAIWLVFLASAIYALFGKFRRPLQITLISLSLYFAIPFLTSELLLFGILPTILLGGTVIWVNSPER